MSEYRVPAVVSAVRVLNVLDADGDGGVSQSELVRATGLSKSTMHNLLKTLEAENFVRRDAQSRRYRLGPALIPLGAAASRQTQLIQLTFDAIAPLAARHGLSFAVAQRTPDDHAQIIERFYPPQDVHVGVTIGSRFGIFDGALGKALLASVGPKRAERLVRRRKLPAHTDSTITDPAALLGQVAEVRERGWAVSEQELNQNNAVAVPVRGLSGEVELYLLALGFPSQLDGEQLTATGRLLREVAESVMEAAGARPAVER
jgi:DNA-binding IclR family transcriptional regulator